MPSSRKLSPALFTDLYELTMAQAYWQSGKTADATFSLFFRRLSRDRGYFVFAGLADALDYLERFHFTEEDVSHLREGKLFHDGFLTFLAGLRFKGSVRAMPEGAIAFANEPVIEVTGPVIEAQLVETFLVNQVNLQTLLASKASRVVHAARGRTVVDFAARRTHGTEAADRLARLSYMVGFAGTSNVLAGGQYEVPTFGTMAHSFVTAFDDETEAFRAYARSFPDSSTFLVDTYDTLEGVRSSITVAKEMAAHGHALRAVRLDSGNLTELARTARAMLDEAGLQDVEVLASGGLDELAVDELVNSGAPLDGFGVGTKVGAVADAPDGEAVYKMVAYDGNPVLKLSAAKATLPGPKQVFRKYLADGRYAGDVIARASEHPSGEAASLLRDVMLDGKRLDPIPPLELLRKRFSEELARLPKEYKSLRAPAAYAVGTSQPLTELTRQVTFDVGRRPQNRRGAKRKR